MSPIVSIIIPCFNYGHFLESTLTSIQKQSLYHWECIIVDDGSTDKTAEISDKFCRSDRRFSYVYQQNKGLSAARNKGLEMINGKLVQFLDADDFISDKKLELQSEFMLAHLDVDISYTDAFYFPDQDPNSYYRTFELSNDQWIPKFETTGIKLIEYLLGNNIAPINSMLVRKEIFEKVGNFNPCYKSLEDWEFWTRCALAGSRFGWFESPKAYALVRVHNQSMTRNNNKMDFYFIKHISDFCKKLRNSPHSEHKLLLIQNKRRIDLNIRSKISKIGLFNIKFLTLIASETGWSKFLKLYIKELNAFQRQLHSTNAANAQIFKGWKYRN